MNPARWQQVKQLFHQAAEHQPATRAIYLDEICAEDEELRRELESLLASHDEAPDFIEVPAFEAGAGGSRPDDRDGFAVGMRIGAYKITGKIGHGGESLRTQSGSRWPSGYRTADRAGSV